MAFNPMKLMELKNLRNRFAQNHPKFVKFMSDLASSQIEEGTILEVTVKKPDGRTMVSNIKVTASDLEMLQAIKQIFRGKKPLSTSGRLLDTRYSSRYCVTVFPVIFRKRRQQTSRDRCTCSPSFSSEITDSYHYSDAFLTIEAPFYFLLGLLAVYRTSIQSMQNGRTPFAWFGAVALLIPVYYRMMMKPVKTV